MDSYVVIADLAARSRLSDTAFSALPDAPVQPLTVRRRWFARVIVGLIVGMIVGLRRVIDAVTRSAPRSVPRRRTVRRECAGST